ncbi:hypothetical protein AYO21_07586 [Fonsecaea monophora]|uniref:Uncharacterized protein n=1 Tax=Fonsecaea monophora TaxID=254056 RepID=A0A177F1T8_9EURO|nr:hypothetical protein AYO21_07586 [Fonsecaea monophora]OAG38253.1 hypothetical protein AYO21_07586 [Fonsecaea monophora]
MDKQQRASVRSSMKYGSVGSRPGVHEHRTDNEPRVYSELPSFPHFDQPIPPEASLEELCSKYPNHIRGSYLDAFIQWHWSATDIYSCLTYKAIEEFKSFGITKSKAWANRANFLTKRLDARLSSLSAEEVTALCTAPKIRPCMMDGTEKYGASKLQGKFPNPTAPAIRKYPHRQARDDRSPRQLALTRTFKHNGREHQLWDSAEDLHRYKECMVGYWSQSRVRAGQIIDADTVYSASQGLQRKRLILRMTNWPCNSASESFFSFRNIRNCPAFESAIFDLVAAPVISMLDSPNVQVSSQPLRTARESAVSYVLMVQIARLARLNDFAAAIPAGALTAGLVDEVLSWTADLDSDASKAVQPGFGSAHPQSEDVAVSHQSSLEPERTPNASDSGALSSHGSKRKRPNSPTAARPAKRVRFAESTTELESTDLATDANGNLDENSTSAIKGEDVALSPNLPMQDMLEGFDLDPLPWEPIPGGLDLALDLTAADLPAAYEETESEWAVILSEAFDRDSADGNSDENEVTTSSGLPELADNDEEWLREAIENAAEFHGDALP